jgi:hypothetical protein
VLKGMAVVWNTVLWKVQRQEAIYLK